MHGHLEGSQLAARDLLAALSSVHVVAGLGAAGRDLDEVWIADPRRPMRVVVLAAPSFAQVRTLIAETVGPRIAVADRLAVPQRRALTAAGWSWWDRRGALTVVTPDGKIELTPPPVPDVATQLPDPFSRVAGRTVGLALLASPHAGRTVRDVVASTGLSLGAVGRTMRELADAGVLEADGRPRVPAFFDALATAWRPRWYGLRGDVGPTGQAVLDDVLRFGIDASEAKGPGWALVSSEALMAYGGNPAPGPRPQRLLATDERALAWAVHRWGVDGDGDIQIAAPPAPTAVLGRHPWGGAAAAATPWRLAAPLIVALVMAGDPDHELRQSIAAWQPPASVGVSRVW